jgi:hypothetical protein
MREDGKSKTMKKPVIVVLCLVVVVLAAAGYYFFRAGRPAKDSMPGTAPTILSLLPPQAPYVIYTDVESLRSSAFLNRLIALIPTPNEDPDYLEFVRSTGFDYTRDLDRVAIAIYPTPPLPTVVILADGRFDQQKITSYALRTGKAEQRDGHSMYVLPASTPGGEVTIRFIAADRIQLVSHPQGNALAKTDNSDSTTAAMKERISRVAGSPLFAVVRMDAVPKDAVIGSFRIDAITGSMQGVKWLTLSASPSQQNLNVALQGECESTLQATQLNLALGFLRTMARAYLSDKNARKQFTPQGADALTKLVKQADISTTGNRLQLAVSLSPEILDGLAAPPPAKAPIAAPKPAH